MECFGGDVRGRQLGTLGTRGGGSCLKKSQKGRPFFEGRWAESTTGTTIHKSTQKLYRKPAYADLLGSCLDHHHNKACFSIHRAGNFTIDKYCTKWLSNGQLGLFLIGPERRAKMTKPWTMVEVCVQDRPPGTRGDARERTPAKGVRKGSKFILDFYVLQRSVR